MKLLPAALAAAIFLASLPAFAEVQEKTAKIAKTTVQYKVILPKNYDPAKTYPAVLAFGGGPQTMEVVDGTIHRNWQQEAELRGYIVILPAAPNGVLFYEGGEKIFPEFLIKILADYKIKDNKFHAAGMSNGGISAFHVAASHPEYFKSITGFPGYLPNPTAARLKNISKMCINMYVGELDSGWREEVQEQASDFRKMGINAKFSSEKGQFHRIGTLAGSGAARLFDGFEEARNGCAIPLD
jgi:poly(3-hydroxybutyrate) depolymerase